MTAVLDIDSRDLHQTTTPKLVKMDQKTYWIGSDNTRALLFIRETTYTMINIGSNVNCTAKPKTCRVNAACGILLSATGG